MMRSESAPPAPALGYAPTASTDEVAARLRRAKQEREPFSFIRLGDGEGAVLASPDVSPVKALVGTSRLTFGRKLAADEFSKLRLEMGRAIAAADLLGVHEGATIDRFTVARAALPDLLPSSGTQPLLCRAYANIHLAKAGLLAPLVAGERRIGVISCNDLTAPLTGGLGVGQVDFYPVPSEADRAIGRQNPAGPAWNSHAHYPNIFEKIRRRLRVKEPGQIFLVGAGLLAKIYCGWIKERGGIALDLGSVLDGWAGLATRKYLIADPNGYRLTTADNDAEQPQAISAN